MIVGLEEARRILARVEENLKQSDCWEEVFLSGGQKASRVRVGSDTDFWLYGLADAIGIEYPSSRKEPEQTLEEVCSRLRFAWVKGDWEKD